MRLHCFLGERRFSWARDCCHWQLRGSDFSGADDCGVGEVTPPVGFFAAQYTAKTLDEAGMMLRLLPGPFFPAELDRVFALKHVGRSLQKKAAHRG
jgi:hypothetical protein